MSGESIEVCSKCGGETKDGSVIVPIERMSTPEMGSLTPGFMQQGLPPIVDDFTSRIQWEEKTGQRTGFIFKRDERKTMRIRGHRCTNCNYVELYAVE